MTLATRDHLMDIFLKNLSLDYVWKKKEEKFQDLYQGNMTTLSWFITEIEAIKRQKAQKFLKAPRAEIFDQVAILKPNSYVKALEHAKLVEKLIVARYRHINHIHTQQQ